MCTDHQTDPRPSQTDRALALKFPWRGGYASKHCTRVSNENQIVPAVLIYYLHAYWRTCVRDVFLRMRMREPLEIEWAWMMHVHVFWAVVYERAPMLTSVACRFSTYQSVRTGMREHTLTQPIVVSYI